MSVTFSPPAKAPEHLPLVAEFVDTYRKFCADLVELGLTLSPSDRLVFFRIYMSYRKG